MKFAKSSLVNPARKLSLNKKGNQLNYLSQKELDTLEQQGYDLASVQKGIALALGAKPAEQICALMKADSKDNAILKETEKENTMNNAIKDKFNTLTMPDLQYLQTLVKGQLYDLECVLDTAKGFIVAIKELWEDSTIKRESLKYQRFYLRDLRKQRNKLAKLQAKLKRIKV